MFVPFLILRNALRHKLRTTLTLVGIVVGAVWNYVTSAFYTWGRRAN